jgi:host factor-I protein
VEAKTILDSLDRDPNNKITGHKMASEKSQNVQDVFLNHVRKNKLPVTVFLVNGVKLQGIITWFDNFCVLLRREAHSQLVYKHAISTVMPAQPVQLFDPTDANEQQANEQEEE